MNSQRASIKFNNKLFGLELVRFISAIAVLVWHYQHFSFVADKSLNFQREKQPFYSILAIFYEYGHFGVQIFWAISGFIFFWKYGNLIAAKDLGFKKFFALRFTRLYPLHFATLLLAALLQSIYFSQKNYYFVLQDNDIPHFILQLFLASGWGLEKGASFNGSIWSVSVEILIYIFFFLNFKGFGNRFIINFGVVTLCLIAKLLKLSNPVIDCLAFFYIGGITATAFYYFQDKKYKVIADSVCISLLVALPPLAYVTGYYEHRGFAQLVLLIYLPALIFMSAYDLSMPISAQKVISAAGNMTYSSYLIHFPLQILIAIYFAKVNESIPYYSPVFFLVFMALTLTASYYIYRFFEAPAQMYLRIKMA